MMIKTERQAQQMMKLNRFRLPVKFSREKIDDSLRQATSFALMRGPTVIVASG